MILYHGGLWRGAGLDDIDLFRRLSYIRQDEGNYAGFYMTDDYDVAEGYAFLNGGLVFRIRLWPDARVVEYGGDITGVEAERLARMSRSADVIYGLSPLKIREYILLDKGAVESFEEDSGGDRITSRIAGRIFNGIYV